MSIQEAQPAFIAGYSDIPFNLEGIPREYFHSLDWWFVFCMGGEL